VPAAVAAISADRGVVVGVVGVVDDDVVDDAVVDGPLGAAGLAR
jgi:hypothetical protein